MDEQPNDGQRFLSLGDRQQTAVAAALTIIAVVVILTAVLGLGWLLSAFVRRFSSVFLPLAVILTHTLKLGVAGAWLSVTIYIGLVATVNFWRFASGAWRKIDIFKGRKAESV